MMKNKYIIDYVSEMCETLKELKLAVAGLSSFIMENEEKKEVENADNQEVKKRGRKKKQPSENDGGTGAEGESL